MPLASSEKFRTLADDHGGGIVMSNGGSDLEMDPVAVKDLTDGLRSAIGELREFASDGAATTGGGFGKLAMTGMEAGHGQVAGVFGELCSRWEWGVRGLVLSASAVAKALNLSAGMVWEEDQYRKGTFKIAANSVIGNPHADEDETETKSWDEITGSMRPETPEGARRASDDFQQAWDQAKRDSLNKGFTAQMLDTAADHGALDREVLDAARARTTEGG
ncbi:hypothetical protein [Streptomyces sp. NPDC058701]|uniref:hypothetical protein n=1 Tax=Streptomyces sp. NPDC058701 TaxID=3346608 RepID=UPI003646B722